MRWRASRGNRTFAAPAAKVRQVAVAKRRGANRGTGTSVDDSVEALLVFRRPLGLTSHVTLGQLLCSLRAAGMAFADAEAERLAVPLTWQLAAGVAGSTSAIRLVFEDSAQAAAAKNLLYDKAVRIGNDVLTTSFSDEASIVAAAKNARRQS